MNDIAGKTTVVVGASRGLGRGIATAFSAAGARVVAVARSETSLMELAARSTGMRVEVADASEEPASRRILQHYEPDIVIIVAGARPLMAPLQDQTWESFSINWNTDVRIAFVWLRQILVQPMRAGGRTVVISSGAALSGSPLSGGYAGAKATQRFMTGYAREEALRSGLDLSFTTVLPRPSPVTQLGKDAVHAYTTRTGMSERDFLQQIGGTLTPQIAGESLVDLFGTYPLAFAPGYLLTSAGLEELG
jgi:NAD(P)-dependent dehydrogenase (short-subunit alcohol dehydrogenase family)